MPGPIIDSAILIPLLPKGRIDNVLYRAHIGLRSESIGIAALVDLLKKYAPLGHEIVFPSHFFEFEPYRELVSILKNWPRSFYIQISPGAELRDYLEKMRGLLELFPTTLNIELVMDRAPHKADWEILEDLQRGGTGIRYVYCPVREFSPLETMKRLPINIFRDFYFYFPPATKQEASFLSIDEIYIFLKKAVLLQPTLIPRVLRHISAAEFMEEENKIQKEYRNNLSEAIYLENYMEIDKLHGWRRILIYLSKHKSLAPLLAFPKYFIWFLHEPIGASLNIVYHKFIITMRNILLSIFYILRAPIWNLKQHAPILYWSLIYPWQKLYWFSSHAFKKWVLRQR